MLPASASVSADVALIVIDERQLLLWMNQSAERLIPGGSRDLVGLSVWGVLRGAAGLPEAQEHAELEGALGVGARQRPPAVPGSVELLWVGALGDRRRLVWTFSRLPGRSSPAWVGVGVDVTDHRRNEATLRQLAHTDALTGLANRIVVRETLSDHLDSRRGLGCGLLFCDLDGFKAVNDVHGHGVGDRLLVRTAERLLGCVRQGDLVARLGGDEFVVLLPAAGVIETRAAATRVERVMARPIRLDVGQLRVGVSVGHRIAEVGEDAEVVLADADAAMYLVKARRRRARETTAGALGRG